MEGSGYSEPSFFGDGESSYDATDSTSSLEMVLDPTLRPCTPSPDDCEQFTSPEAKTIDYDVHWAYLGDLPPGCCWENGSFFNPNWISPGVMSSQLKVECSDTVIPSPIPTPLMSPPYTEYHVDSTREFQQQTNQANRMCESPFGNVQEYPANRTPPDSYQLPSPAYSSTFLSSDRPSCLTPESSQSPDAAALRFNSSLHDDSDEEDKEATESYAKLIYRALMSAPNHCMVLKDIYKWFERHTTKTRDPKSKGWQNSIRHNLSMNGGFKKTQQSTSVDQANKYIWVLEPWAVVNGGVESTTRYRRYASGKKSSKVKQESGRQILRSLSPGMTLDGPREDSWSAPNLAQHCTRGTADSFPAQPTRFASNDSPNEQLLGPSPYFSLPGPPMTFSATPETGHYSIHGYPSCGISAISSDGD